MTQTTTSDGKDGGTPFEQAPDEPHPFDESHGPSRQKPISFEQPFTPEEIQRQVDAYLYGERPKGSDVDRAA